jgi:hypothetical protein
MLFFDTPHLRAAGNNHSRQGSYLVIEGNVSILKTRMLVIDGQQYPISVFVRVFDGNDRNREMKMQDLVNVGRIDSARLYLLGGKVEKIVVLKNL